MSHEHNDRGSYTILMTCAGIGLAALVVAPAFVPGAVIRPTALAFAIGLAIYLAGFAMRRWSEMTLGRYFTFTVMTSAEQPVITAGPYRFVRHPGYIGVMPQLRLGAQAADPARVVRFA
jgi:protein-S-isoprenylcysteine O-methyltransferase Ste14